MTEYKITPGLEALIVLKHPQPTQFNSSDYKAYKSFVAQTKVKSIGQATLINHILHGNGSICARKWLHLEKG